MSFDGIVESQTVLRKSNCTSLLRGIASNFQQILERLKLWGDCLIAQASDSNTLPLKFSPWGLSNSAHPPLNDKTWRIVVLKKKMWRHWFRDQWNNPFAVRHGNFSNKSDSLFSVKVSDVLWNLFCYYKQFIPSVEQSLQEMRKPIEKDLKVSCFISVLSRSKQMCNEIWDKTEL